MIQTIPATDQDPSAYTCPTCRTRIREGQVHSTGNRKNVPAHQVLVIVRERLPEEDWGRAPLWFDPPKDPTRRKGRRVTKPIVLNETTGWWEVAK